MRDNNKQVLQVVSACRGEGLGYVVVRSGVPMERLRATASLKDCTAVPCELYPVASPSLLDVLAPGSFSAWVLVLPLLAYDCMLRFSCDGEELLTVAFSPLRSKVFSRLFATTKPDAATALRGFEKRYASGRTQATIAEVWPAGEGNVVWRVRACYAADSKAAVPRLRVYDPCARELSAHVVVMEDQVAPSSRDASQFVRLLTFSCTLPEKQRSFFVVADLEGVDGSSALDGMNAPRAAGMLEGVRRLTGGASGNDAYGSWFEEHRAAPAELARQREAYDVLDKTATPLFSLVVTVRTDEEGIRLCPIEERRREMGNGPSSLEAHLPALITRKIRGAAAVVPPRGDTLPPTSPRWGTPLISSLLSQSYARWELVVVDARGESEDVLLVPNDGRIRVVDARGLAEARAADRGIAAARGDYAGFVGVEDALEPDALWRFYRETLLHPLADLLYSDEDCTDGPRHLAPIFKTFPNYGKLYTRNYLGRLMLVSRWALEHTLQSQDGVEEALEYDLALRVFEVARDVVHVPYVLYHRHRGGEMPYTHDAGKHALQSHLGRRGIAARVEDGPSLHTYRVRYELPNPMAPVSIVIPTRDQAALLKTCVTSILRKSTYPNYEIVLVENNSSDVWTFELYKELTEQDGRVRVVTWTPPEPDAFNYSAIVNYGVAQSRGELVVLLNNDTEVIEPAWLEEMAGCLMRPEVGVVGAKLLFGDGLIQHVGMVANPEGNFCHACQNLAHDALGPDDAAMLPGDYSMVTGACQMVRRSLFDELGGYDEDLAVGFNDGDFCLRAREAGYAVTVCVQALLHHREFSSRGRELTDARLRERYLRERAIMTGKHAAFFAQGDPAINPNLDPFGWYFNL